MKTAIELKERGQQLALAYAGLKWTDIVMLALRVFISNIRAKGESEFTFEEFRLFCDMNDIPAPASLNAWGALPRIAAREGLCRWTGFVKPAVRGPSHGRIIKVWSAA